MGDGSMRGDERRQRAAGSATPGTPETTEQDDAGLVRRALSGDDGAFEILVRRHERLVFRVVGGFFRSRADVEDAAQETFLRAFRALASFRGERFAPWVARVAATASLDRLRRRRRRPEVGWDVLPEDERRAVDALAEGRNPEDRAAARDLAERALSRLKPADRALVLLVDGHGLTPGEAAGALGSTALAARVRLHRARRALRRMAAALLDQHPGGTEGGDR
jgi:RNA polymerase sigma-70 factor (ECF subfamily)